MRSIACLYQKCPNEKHCHHVHHKTPLQKPASGGWHPFLPRQFAGDLEAV
jgi:hypothetical protein